MVQRDYVQKEWFKGIMYRNNGSIGLCIERMIQRDYVQKERSNRIMYRKNGPIGLCTER